MVIVIIVIGGFASMNDSDDKIMDEETTIKVEKKVDDADNKEETSNAEETSEKEDTSSSISVSKQNALRSAKDYLSSMAFSRDGLIEQLEFEEFTHDQAVYGVNSVGL